MMECSEVIIHHIDIKPTITSVIVIAEQELNR